MAKGVGNLARIALNAGRLTNETGSRDVVDIITFIEAEWGLSMTLFPIQKIILKAHYGIPLDNDPNNKFSITDFRRDNEQWFTEAEYLAWLYDQGRANIREVIAGEERRNMILSIGRRSGKCVTGGTLVLTDGGVQRIEDLGNPEGPEVQPLTVGIVQEANVRSKSAYFYNGGVKPTVGYETRCGYRLEGTENHRVRVMGEDGTIQWRYLGDLQVGDQIAVHRTSDLWASEYVDVTKFTNGRGRKNIQFPEKLTERWGLLLGALVGDGGWTNRASVSMTIEHHETWMQMFGLFSELLGEEPSVTLDQRTEHTGALRVHSVAWREFLHEIGFNWDAGRYDKAIPWSILKSPKSVVCSFLQGLFETDGGVESNGKTVSFSTASGRLAREVQTLLMNMGIVSRVKAKWNSTTERHYYYLNIRGLRSRQAFADQIGFLSQKKMAPLLASLEAAGKEGGDTESIPHQKAWVRKLLHSVPKAKPGQGWSRSTLRQKLGNTCKPNSDENISYPRLRDALRVAVEVGADEEVIKHFEYIQAADYFFDPVVEMWEGEEQVFDLNVPDGASFVANGMTNHNTTISACIAAYETYKLINKGNPQKYYGLTPSNQIQLISVATGKDQAGLLYQEVSGHFNKCLAGETEVITDQGIQPIRDLVGTSPTLLTGDGSWVQAPVRSFGTEKLYAVRLKRQGREKVVYATADHRWFSRDARSQYRGKGFQEFTTLELRPEKHRLQMTFGRSWKNRIHPSAFGVAHGFTFGDGTTTPGKRNATCVHLIGKKDRVMADYFPMSPQTEVPAINGVKISALPNFFRRLPDINENKAYLLGWLMGYFAADGSCDKTGSIILSSVHKKNLEYVRGVCALLGIGTFGIRHQDRVSNMTGKNSRIYTICLMGHTLSEDFFLIPDHKENFRNNGCDELKRDATSWRVVAVEETDRVEEVFCATVEGHGNFTLADNIVTGNCSFFRRYTANNTMSYARFQTPNDIDHFGPYSENPKARASIKVTFAACNAKGLRGAGNIVIILDEVAHFVEAGGSSAENVYDAVAPSAAGFTPKDNFGKPVEGKNTPSDGRVILISSPLGKQGLFYKMFEIGKSGGDAAKNMLCIQAPTWEVNPTVSANVFLEAYAKDPNVFFTEFGGEFTDRTLGWMDKPEDLLQCIDPDLKPRSRGEARRPHFVGFDLGLVNDASALAICHLDENNKVVLDYIGQIKAGEGQYADKERLEFDDVVNWIYGLSRRFYFAQGMFDMWNAIPLEQGLAKKGLQQLKGEHMTAQLNSQIYQNFKSLLWDKRVRLYDMTDQERAALKERDGKQAPNHLPYIEEILELQAEFKSKYIINVAAPNSSGKHDDMSDALARAVWLASQSISNPKIIAGASKNLDPNQPKISAAIKRRNHRMRLLGGSDPKRQIHKKRGR